MGKCYHQGDRSGELEPIMRGGIQGLTPLTFRRVERCMNCGYVFREPVTREEWRAKLEAEIREELIAKIEAIPDRGSALVSYGATTLAKGFVWKEEVLEVLRNG